MAFMAPILGSAFTGGVAATAAAAGTGAWATGIGLSTILGGASTALNILGTARQASAQRAEGRAREQAGINANIQAKYQAEQLEQKAGQERAVSQRKAQELRRRARIAESRALAVGAASGAGGFTDIMAGIVAEGELSAQSAIYEGEERARGIEMSAEAKRYEGFQAQTAGGVAKEAAYKGSQSTILGGIAKLGKGLADKYAPSPEASPEWSWG